MNMQIPFDTFWHGENMFSEKRRIFQSVETPKPLSDRIVDFLRMPQSGDLDKLITDANESKDKEGVLEKVINNLQSLEDKERIQIAENLPAIEKRISALQVYDYTMLDLRLLRGMIAEVEKSLEPSEQVFTQKQEDQNENNSSKEEKHVEDVSDESTEISLPKKGNKDPEKKATFIGGVGKVSEQLVDAVLPEKITKKMTKEQKIWAAGIGTVGVVVLAYGVYRFGKWLFSHGKKAGEAGQEVAKTAKGGWFKKFLIASGVAAAAFLGFKIYNDWESFKKMFSREGLSEMFGEKVRKLRGAYDEKAKELKSKIAVLERRVDQQTSGEEPWRKYGISEEKYERAVEAYKRGKGKELEDIYRIFGVEKSNAMKNPKCKAFLNDMQTRYEWKEKEGIRYVSIGIALENYAFEMDTALKRLNEWARNNWAKLTIGVFIARKLKIDVAVFKAGKLTIEQTAKLAKFLVKNSVSHPILSLFLLGGSIMALRNTLRIDENGIMLPESLRELAKAAHEQKDVVIGLLDNLPEGARSLIDEIGIYASGLETMSEEYVTWSGKQIESFGQQFLSEDLPELIALSQGEQSANDHSATMLRLRKRLEQSIKPNALTEDKEAYESAIEALDNYETVFLRERSYALARYQLEVGELPTSDDITTAYQELETALRKVNITLNVADGIVRWSKKDDQDVHDLTVDPTVTDPEKFYDLSENTLRGGEASVEHVIERTCIYIRRLQNDAKEKGLDITKNKGIAMGIGNFLYLVEFDWKTVGLDLDHIKEVIAVPINFYGTLVGRPIGKLLGDKRTWTDYGEDIAELWGKSIAVNFAVSLGMQPFTRFKRILFRGGVLRNPSTTLVKRAVGGVVRFGRGALKNMIPGRGLRVIPETYGGVQDVVFSLKTISRSRFWSTYLRARTLNTAFRNAGVRQAWLKSIENPKISSWKLKRIMASLGIYKGDKIKSLFRSNEFAELISITRKEILRRLGEVYLGERIPNPTVLGRNSWRGAKLGEEGAKEMYRYALSSYGMEEVADDLFGATGISNTTTPKLHTPKTQVYDPSPPKSPPVEPPVEPARRVAGGGGVQPEPKIKFNSDFVDDVSPNWRVIRQNGERVSPVDPFAPESVAGPVETAETANAWKSESRINEAVANTERAAAPGAAGRTARAAEEAAEESVDLAKAAKISKLSNILNAIGIAGDCALIAATLYEMRQTAKLLEKTPDTSEVKSLYEQRYAGYYYPQLAVGCTGATAGTALIFGIGETVAAPVAIATLPISAVLAGTHAAHQFREEEARSVKDIIRENQAPDAVLEMMRHSGLWRNIGFNLNTMQASDILLGRAAGFRELTRLDKFRLTDINEKNARALVEMVTTVGVPTILKVRNADGAFEEKVPTNDEKIFYQECANVYYKAKVGYILEHAHGNAMAPLSNEQTLVFLLRNAESYARLKYDDFIAGKNGSGKPSDKLEAKTDLGQSIEYAEKLNKNALKNILIKRIADISFSEDANEGGGRGVGVLESQTFPGMLMAYAMPYILDLKVRLKEENIRNYLPDGNAPEIVETYIMLRFQNAVAEHSKKLAGAVEVNANKIACRNVSDRTGKTIDTYVNTLYETLASAHAAIHSVFYSKPTLNGIWEDMSDRYAKNIENLIRQRRRIAFLSKNRTPKTHVDYGTHDQVGLRRDLENARMIEKSILDWFKKHAE